MKASSKILVPVDFTSQAAAAVRRAVDIARPAGAEVILVQFHDAVRYPLPLDSFVSTRAHLQQLRMGSVTEKVMRGTPAPCSP